MSFNRVEFWVQIHNLSLLCMKEEIGFFLGKMIGEVSDFDTGTMMEGSSSFLRGRVKVPVDKPLQRSLRVDLLGNGKVTTMPLRYERLQDYGFKCGRLGHVMEGCPDETTNGSLSLDEMRRLGVWLRASSPPKRSPFGAVRYGTKDWNKQGSLERPNLVTDNPGPNVESWRRKLVVQMQISGESEKKANGRSKGKEKADVIVNRNPCMEIEDSIINEQPHFSMVDEVGGQMSALSNKKRTDLREAGDGTSKASVEKSHDLGPSQEIKYDTPKIEAPETGLSYESGIGKFSPC
ncbi:hypothetical protein Dsin_000360 [Dipteronia sinensis]|uniref:Zinc knuckle CX2CX4HX4C domain-containing protein n=1 Tax=Dipteronia sinensis TaxID=43782 RepID=A0AAE0B398_9ROSI|nr:hypothetical protein Dsin_000360 [Dipteronia sinensis]